jgi:hypothetical protein
MERGWVRSTSRTRSKTGGLANFQFALMLTRCGWVCDHGRGPFISALRSRRFAGLIRPMKIVLAYSGGLDTSVLLSWIKEKYNAEMIAFCADIGQEEELHGLEKKARNTGAAKIYIDDLQEEFATDFIYPIIHAGAIYEGQYFLGATAHRQAHGRDRQAGKGRRHRPRRDRQGQRSGAL